MCAQHSSPDATRPTTIAISLRSSTRVQVHVHRCPTSMCTRLPSSPVSRTFTVNKVHLHELENHLVPLSLFPSVFGARSLRVLRAGHERAVVSGRVLVCRITRPPLNPPSSFPRATSHSHQLLNVRHGLARAGGQRRHAQCALAAAPGAALARRRSASSSQGRRTPRPSPSM